MAEPTGEDVLHAGLDVACEEVDRAPVAAYALGSLAHGGFAALVSDVDLMLVLDRVDAGTGAAAGRVRDRLPGLLGGGLPERLSVFWADPAGVRTGAGPLDRLPEVDRLDLLESGRLLRGTDVRDRAVTPERSVLVRQAVEFVLERFDDRYLDRLADPARLIADGPRAVTKAVLFPVRFRYTLHTGRIGRSDAAALWSSGRGEHTALVSAASTWRHAGLPGPAEALDVLRAELVPAYRAFVRDHVRALDTAGERVLARDLTRWGERLDAAG